MRTENEVLEQLLEFANSEDRVRAVTFNGSRVNPKENGLTNIFPRNYSMNSGVHIQMPIMNIYGAHFSMPESLSGK